VRFSCSAISEKKKWFKKREFFMPHHFEEKKWFKKREFFMPHQLAEKKTVQKT
jgi:hypothetical protein